MSGDRETATMLAAVVLVALVLLAGVSGETGLRGAIGLSIAAVAWFLVNGPMEGPILVVVSDSNGLTGADLAGVAALALAIWRARVALRHRGRR